MKNNDLAGGALVVVKFRNCIVYLQTSDLILSYSILFMMYMTINSIVWLFFIYFRVFSSCEVVGGCWVLLSQGHAYFPTYCTQLLLHLSSSCEVAETLLNSVIYVWGMMDLGMFWLTCFWVIYWTWKLDLLVPVSCMQERRYRFTFNKFVTCTHGRFIEL